MHTIISITAIIAIVLVHILTIVKVHRRDGEARCKPEKPCRNETAQCC